MGKPSPPTRPSDDAVSLHTQRGHSYLDEDAPELSVDDLPPLYDENPQASSSAPLLPATDTPGIQYPDYQEVAFYKRDGTTGLERVIDGRFDRDPKALESYVQTWAQTPPRPFARLYGTHWETVKKNGKDERKSVVDFDIWIELTPYLFSNDGSHQSWRELRTVENSEKVRRGTVLRKRAPGSNRGLELGLGPAKPTLEEWCHRYCASHAGLKCFTMHRRVNGLNHNRLKDMLHSLIRATNYQGHLDITFPVKDASMEIYNDCDVNRWRLTSWIFWVCVFTLTIIFTWPYLFFCTKRFEVVVVDWAFSTTDERGSRRCISINEDQFYHMWGIDIQRAALCRTQGVITRLQFQGPGAEEPTVSRALAEGAASFVQAGILAMSAVNRSLGWGHDTAA